ncbi:NAD(P)/FAD-dependent oxidoreductase [Vagococcus vulneris]|uniref:Ferredoxin--NADP reductase n=1 Tax=Vagococcus vulneris TaxID=1977869 RepID=A0A429ZWF0_9ENTE|nr:NAD(P)/FAD-dependent oxidoreductase [Vagococcus vulneris]RST98074.1 ferredoxin--NADP(+) reductase [Vagococcus vulneris]
MSQDVYDITIIGGGPAGLFASFYAGMRQAKTKIIDTLPELGGQLAILYPEKYIYDIAGFPTIKAQDLVDSLIEQAAPFKHSICLGEAVESINKLESGCFELITNKARHLSKTIIIAAGNGSFQPRRLNVDGHKLFENKQLHYHIKDSQMFQDKNVVIFGGGDSAIDWSLMLDGIAKSVTVVHRRPQFRAHEYSMKQVKQSTVKLKTPYVVQTLHHEAGKLNGVTIENPKQGEQETLPADHIIVSYGFASSLGPIKKWGLDLKGNSIIVNSDMSTNHEGIFAIGDIAFYQGKVDLIATGFGEAPIAVNHAIHYINPKERVQPMHSTSLYEQSPDK